jgi:O-antigen/teichoic acid export membrane protein
VRLLRNSAYSLLATAFPAFVSIATLPLFVSTIGAERYGILAIAWIVLGYFGAADFGLGRAITQRISAMRGESRGAMARAVWSALISMLAFGLAGALLVFICARWYFAGPFEVEAGLRGEILAAVWILALCNPVMAVSGVLSGALIGLERFRLVSACNVLSNSGLLLFPLAVACFVSTDLSALILASLCARLLGAGLLVAGVWKTFLSGHKPAFFGGEFRRLANFGAWIMVTALIGPFMVFADRFVIGAVQDAAAVAAYVIPFQIASRTQIFPMAVAQALFPRFASEAAEASVTRCREYAVFFGQMFAPLIIGLICLAAPLLALWLGDALDLRSILVAQLVLAGFWINAVAQVPYGFIQARGNPRFTALVHVTELPFYLLLLFVLGTQYGLAGYAAAFALRCTADCVILCHKAGAADRFVFGRLAAPALLVLAAMAVGATVADWWALLLAACGLGALSLAALLYSMPDPIRTRLVQVPILSGYAGRLLLMGRPRAGDRPKL